MSKPIIKSKIQGHKKMSHSQNLNKRDENGELINSLCIKCQLIKKKPKLIKDVDLSIIQYFEKS